MKRVNCVTAGCDTCSKAVLVGKTFYWEEPLYSCSAYRKKHKKIDAEDCNAFKCLNPGKLRNICKNCINCK